DVFVHTSDFEGMPNAVMEAMAMGLPVVASAVDGTCELIEEGVSGYLLPPGDVDAFAQRIRELMEDSDLAHQLGEKAHRDVLERFGMARMIEAYEQLFLSLVDSKSALCLWSGNTDELGVIVRLTFALRLITSFFFTFAIALLIRPLLDLLGQPSYLALMQRSLLLIALYSIMEYFKYLFEALHRLRFTFVINALEHGSKLILVIALFRGGDRFLAIVTAFTIAVAVAFVVGVILTLGTIPGIFASPAPPRKMREVY